MLLPVSMGYAHMHICSLANFFCLQKLEFKIRNQSKFLSYHFLVTLEIKLEIGLSINRNARNRDELYDKGQKIQNKDHCSHFLFLCFAPGHERWCQASIKVSSCLNLPPRYTPGVFDNLSSEAVVIHSVNIYSPSPVAQAQCSGAGIN